MRHRGQAGWGRQHCRVERAGEQAAATALNQGRGRGAGEPVAQQAQGGWRAAAAAGVTREKNGAALLLLLGLTREKK